MQSVTLSELAAWQAVGRKFILIDVREPEEHYQFNIGGTLIPFGEVMRRVAEFDAAVEVPVVVYCKKGIRSRLVIQRLQNLLPHVVFYNLEGGICKLLH